MHARTHPPTHPRPHVHTHALYYFPKPNSKGEDHEWQPQFVSIKIPFCDKNEKNVMTQKED